MIKSVDGSVTLRLFFNARGFVTRAVIWVSSGDRARDNECIRAYAGAQLSTQSKAPRGRFQVTSQYLNVRIEKHVVIEKQDRIILKGWQK
ncbi:hypothetical protein BSY44_23020 [Salmonella enterica subsp. enterica serovar Paratyphi B]|uniref:TonB C-terminal domain-containing protein n=1 Tax=Salmonella dublin TaxID=98360 RepID=A0A732CVF1_SALDU|nr:hypothetical protein [Salmonella enterica]EAW1288336.1 hypothetical protein [Salmonella enterica subsp. enterica]ECO1613292.1 hypothetical protein [Salmonella enterica subsp. enterica serovar Paratyphi B]EDK5264509.1 hypothetical protein [Salmonella enterica subsp. enterica serovar Enteritidis]EDN8389346.1 hypothetical protein [Salmonella enterica subsp. enterica serovar Wandsworth]EDU1385351.1 hypothetical protein [Salmonella enterica subsp. enterica serovar 4,[5],12:b:-]EGZ3914838.1 hypo